MNWSDPIDLNALEGEERDVIELLPSEEKK
jgi:hypothetical protein